MLQEVYLPVKKGNLDTILNALEGHILVLEEGKQTTYAIVTTSVELYDTNDVLALEVRSLKDTREPVYYNSNNEIFDAINKEEEKMNRTKVVEVSDRWFMTRRAAEMYMEQVKNGCEIPELHDIYIFEDHEVKPWYPYCVRNEKHEYISLKEAPRVNLKRSDLDDLYGRTMGI